MDGLTENQLEVVKTALDTVLDMVDRTSGSQDTLLAEIIREHGNGGYLMDIVREAEEDE